MGTGGSGYSSTCNGAGVVTGPYTYRECWPDFYTPVVSDGHFTATARDEEAYIASLGCCGDGCFGPIGLLERYPEAIGCRAGSEHTVEATDSCGGGVDPGDGGGTPPTCDVYDPWSCQCNDDWLCYDIYGEDYGCDEWGYCDSLYADGPLLIDVNGDGYSLTSAANGVVFDLRANGMPKKFSWTAPDSDDAWLALDRNGNGLIDDGSELFGNSTPHSGGGRDTNGFKALAFYDLSENGGNGDGVIDSHDAVFPRLLVWVDKNHNGVSDAGELYSLTQSAITGVLLDYKASKWVDAYGNRFRFRTKVLRNKPGPGTDHWAYDVYLVPNASR
jgi:hypothetical protein